jgi:AhpD family alkylhydroperoxidase
MALVELLEAADAPLLARPYFANGDPGPIVASMAHVPELLDVSLPFIGAVLGASSIPFRTKEIVILRTSVRAGCRYCVDTHTPIAMESGLSMQQTAGLRDLDTAAACVLFTAERDIALVRWTDALAGEIGTVGEAVSSEMKQWFNDAEIVELTLLVGCTLLLNRYATALQLPVSDDCVQKLASLGFGQ